MAIITRITTDDTLMDDLRGSLRERGVPWDGSLAGLFAAVTAFGVKPGDFIASMEVGCSATGRHRIVVEDNGGGWEVRELQS